MTGKTETCHGLLCYKNFFARLIYMVLHLIQKLLYTNLKNQKQILSYLNKILHGGKMDQFVTAIVLRLYVFS